MRIRLLAGGLVVLVALLAGCSDSDGAGAPADDVQRVTVEMAELTYEPMRLSVEAGRPVEVTVRNVGTTDHDFVVAGLRAKDIKRVTAGHGGHGGGDEIVGHAKPKQTVTVRFTPLATGDFEIFCSLPGHREGGMVGVLTVA